MLWTVLKILIYKGFFFVHIAMSKTWVFPFWKVGWNLVCQVIRLTKKPRLNVLLMMNLLTLSRAMNVALARCNFKCSPYEGMLVQGRIEVLSMIMISMSPICVSKDCVKQRRFVYKLCSLWEWLNCQVLCQKRCSIPLESPCSTSTCIELPSMFFPFHHVQQQMLNVWKIF